MLVGFFFFLYKKETGKVLLNNRLGKRVLEKRSIQSAPYVYNKSVPQRWIHF